MRLFIGIKIDDKAKKKINSYFNLLYENKVTGNYTKISNLHMTLVFIGEISEDKVEVIKGILRSIEIKTNVINITKMTMLKDILIGEVKEEKALLDMYDSIKAKLREAKINFDDHSLYPHITLIRKVNNQEKFVGKDMNIDSYFDHITLFESKRINNDLVYIDLGK